MWTHQKMMQNHDLDMLGTFNDGNDDWFESSKDHCNLLIWKTYARVCSQALPMVIFSHISMASGNEFGWIFPH